ANVYHAYQVVRANNVPPENIITIAVDDIANNRKNPFNGKVFHDCEHEDVYEGVVIDYRGRVIGSLPVGKFQGHYDLLMHRNGEEVAESTCRLDVQEKIPRNHTSGYFQLGHIVKETFHDIIMDVTTNYKPT
ncbi:hypothetical protein T265_15438, partial [Opisthorchis viverrini]